MAKSDYPDITTVEQAISAARDEGFTSMAAAKLLADEVLRLRGVVGWLPKTRDGAVRRPGSSAFYVARFGEIVEVRVCCLRWLLHHDRWEAVVVGHWDGVKHLEHLSDCYSTREAAEAAREAK